MVTFGRGGKKTREQGLGWGISMWYLFLIIIIMIILPPLLTDIYTQTHITTSRRELKLEEQKGKYKRKCKFLMLWQNTTSICNFYRK